MRAFRIKVSVEGDVLCRGVMQVVNGGRLPKSVVASAGIGTYFNLKQGIWANSYVNWTGRTLSHAVVGGLSSEAQGGEFRHGFYSAALSNGVMHIKGVEGFMGDSAGGWHVAARTAVAALIGGTAAELSGGKFANGAATSAIQHLFNAEMSKKAVQDNRSNPLKNKAVLGFLQNAGNSVDDIFVSSDAPLFGLTLNGYATNSVNSIAIDGANWFVKGYCDVTNSRSGTSLDWRDYMLDDVGYIGAFKTPVLNVCYDSVRDSYSTYYSFSQASASSSLQIRHNLSWYKISYPATIGLNYSIYNGYWKANISTPVKVNLSGVVSYGIQTSFSAKW